MATINASTSGVGGVITTADATGVLDLQTADVTRASVSSSGLKISRVDSSNEGGQLDLCRSSDNTSAWAIDVYGSTSTPSLRFIDNVAATERMRIDSSGNLMVGTTTPRQNITSAQNSASGTGIEIENLNIGSNTTKTAFLNFSGRDTLSAYKTSAQILVTPQDVNYVGASLSFLTRGSDALAERMRIDASGNVSIGSAGTAITNSGQRMSITCNLNASVFDFYKNQDGIVCFFVRSGNIVGNINVTASTTAYATSSDYRLKENIAPMTGALEIVAQLKPVTYKWKVDGSDGQGFIAHELQEVVPDAVIGEKDAVDDEGKPKYQGIDTSFLVATLTAAIQELKSIIDTQAERIAVLENK